MLAVDDMHQNLPPLEKDKYWVDKGPSYPLANTKPVFMGSTHDMRWRTEIHKYFKFVNIKWAELYVGRNIKK